MIKEILLIIPENMRLSVAREIYALNRAKEAEKIIIESRIRHLFSVGYTAKQIVLSLSNEFNKSKRSIYRYIEEVRNGED